MSHRLPALDGITLTEASGLASWTGTFAGANIDLDPAGAFTLDMDAGQSATFTTTPQDGSNGFTFAGAFGDHNSAAILTLSLTRSGGMLTTADGVVGLSATVAGHAADVADTSVTAINLTCDSNPGLANTVGLYIGGTAWTTGIQLESNITFEFGDGSEFAVDFDGTSLRIIGAAPIVFGATDFDLSGVTGKIIVNGTSNSAAALSEGNAVVRTASGTWAKANATTIAAFRKPRICVNAAVAGGVATDIAAPGTVCLVSSDLSAATVGNLVYLSETAGEVTTTAPATSGSQVIIMGEVWTAAVAGSAKILVYEPEYSHTV